jgi:Protein of unknown function (DUF4054)
MAIVFDIANFRLLFPVFSNSLTYPDVTLQASFDFAGLYINNTDSSSLCCGGMSLAELTQVLNLMTAHLLAINAQAMQSGVGASGGGLLTGATIDKVSVTFAAPPSATQWEWWLNKTPYGAQIATLLAMMTVGGCSYGGDPAYNAFRR